MKFEIKCATFVRLASICSFFEPDVVQEFRDKLCTVRIEIINGVARAIATNVKIAAIEFLGYTMPGENGVAHIVLDPKLIAQCKAEAFIDGTLTITTIPEIATAMATTSSGWGYQGNACYWFDETPMDHWRKWAPSPEEIPSKTKGVMAWRLAHVQALFESSPSGQIYFQRHIDAAIPAVIRDRNNPNWVGLFIPSHSKTEEQKLSAELPDWWKL